MALSMESKHSATTGLRPLGRRALIGPSTGAGLPMRKFAAAFSLIEVTLALGLVSIAVLPVMGLLPGGLTTLRQSMNHTVETQIVQAIAAQSVISPFSALATGARYFDDEGFPVSSAADPRRRYTATVTVNPPAYPGSTTAAAIGNSLSNVQITLVSLMETKVFALQIANSGK